MAAPLLTRAGRPGQAVAYGNRLDGDEDLGKASVADYSFHSGGCYKACLSKGDFCQRFNMYTNHKLSPQTSWYNDIMAMEYGDSRRDRRVWCQGAPPSPCSPPRLADRRPLRARVSRDLRPPVESLPCTPLTSLMMPCPPLQSLPCNFPQPPCQWHALPCGELRLLALTVVVTWSDSALNTYPAA